MFLFVYEGQDEANIFFFATERTDRQTERHKRERESGVKIKKVGEIERRRGWEERK